MQTGLLKIGDKMYNAKQDGFEDFVRYSFSEVVCLTKTLAVLKNGTRLVNKSRVSFLEAIGYSVSQKKGIHWHILTIDTIREAQKEQQKIIIHEWFETKVFSFEEKVKIYSNFID
jgi:hypothetical protein